MTDDDSYEYHSSKKQRVQDNNTSLSLYKPNLQDNDYTDYNHHNNNDNTIRTSSLQYPTMKLTGHKGSIYCIDFSPNGECLASGSFDMDVLLWNISSSNDDDTDIITTSNSCGCENFNVLKGHQNAILDLKFSRASSSSSGNTSTGGGGGEYLVTGSADHTCAFWDIQTGMRIKRFQGHEGIVNAVDTSRTHCKLLVSASDDATVRIWDARVKGHVGCLDHDYACTAVAYGVDGNVVYTGGIDNFIYCWDIRMQSKADIGRHYGNRSRRMSNNNNHDNDDDDDLDDDGGGSRRGLMMKMKGHEDTITCLALHPKGTHLLSNSMDSTMKSWDVRPYVVDGKKRLCKTFVGASHNAEKGLLNCSWSSDGTMVTGGSADWVVHVWDELTSEELYFLPGHSGCVNSVIFHPHENVIASASSDKSIYIGELSN